MDPRLGPVTVTITGTAAQHLQRLADATGESGGAIVMRALGLFDLALKAKREGKRIGLVDSSGQVSEVAF